MAKKTKAATKKPRRDGRKSMLVYMKTEIADVKQRATATDRKAWQFVE
ncbi:hypothetical protein [Rhodopseudomonas sp.]